MRKLVIYRVLAIFPLMFLASTLTFFLMQLSDRDPASSIVGETATQEYVQQVRHELGLDRPVLVQYSDWLGGVLQGDLGISYFGGDRVSDKIVKALPVTLSLMGGGIFVGVLVGVPMGVIAAVRAGRATDRVTSGLATAGMAIPNFWLAMILISVFAIRLPWFPAIGFVSFGDSPLGWLRSIVLPSLALGLTAAASIARQMRSELIGVFQQEYIRTALGKGLTVRRTILRHSLKNAAPPVLTAVAYQIALLFGGTLIIERLFVLPGLGTVAIDSVLRNDSPTTLGVVVVTVAIVVLVYLVLDIAYAWVNPRVRLA